jgi:hypothetical protein
MWHHSRGLTSGEHGGEEASQFLLTMSTMISLASCENEREY